MDEVYNGLVTKVHDSILDVLAINAELGPASDIQIRLLLEVLALNIILLERTKQNDIQRED